jgi:glutamate carboxypeptidase
LLPTLITVLLTAAVAGPAAAAPDERLLAAARAAQAPLVETLKAMVAIESGTMDRPGLVRIADYAEQRLKALGGQVERRAPATGNGDVFVARWQGTGRRRLMLIAHLDTVYWPKTLETQPIRQDGNKLYGPGIADDKGGVALILHSLDILQRSGWQDYATLTVLFNGDEESGSAGSAQAIAALGAEHDVVLSYEPTDARDPGVLLAAAGVGSVTMNVAGRASHAGAAPQLGRNALIELSYQMLATADIAKGVPGAQLNWTTMSAGNVRNQIPDKATAHADVRFIAAGADQALLAALQAKVAASSAVPDTQTTLKLDVGRPAFVGDARTRALAQRAQAIHAELRLPKPLSIHPITGGGTDAGWAQASGKAAVLESLGLPGFGYHAKDEYIDLDSIVPRLYLSTRLLTELGKD